MEVAPSAGAAALAAVRQDLAQGLEQLAELEKLVVELPEIFERKFAQRLQPLLERQRVLSDDNHVLRERLQLVLPPAQECEQAAPDPAPLDRNSACPSPPQGPLAWRRLLHQARRRLLGREP